MSDTHQSFFIIRQNNSGGRFLPPAVSVIIESPTLDAAVFAIEQHGVSMCSDSGLYAAYDDCGCCPCCGHRWTRPWDDDPLERDVIEHLVEQLRSDDLEWLGGVAFALIKADGTLIVGDTREKSVEISSYLLTP